MDVKHQLTLILTYPPQLKKIIKKIVLSWVLVCSQGSLALKVTSVEIQVSHCWELSSLKNRVMYYQESTKEGGTWF